MPSVILCLVSYTTVQRFLEQHAEKGVALVSVVFAGADAAVETLEDSSACQLGGQEEWIAPSKMPFSKLFYFSRKHLQCLLLGSLLLGLARKVASWSSIGTRGLEMGKGEGH